jgi:hypothetical protein
MTHCRICGAQDQEIGESIICESCADKKENKNPKNCICDQYTTCEDCLEANRKEQEPTYGDLIDFTRWTQTLWKTGIEIMRNNNLVIKSDEPMEKLTFTFYMDLCEIDSKASHLFSEGYGDKNYKDESAIACQTITSYPRPYEQKIREDERKKVYDELGVLHGEDAKRFREYCEKPHPIGKRAREIIEQAQDLAKQHEQNMVSTKQCENCIRKGLRDCMYHGYPENNIPISCQYKIGNAAVDTVYDIPTLIHKSKAGERK